MIKFTRRCFLQSAGAAASLVGVNQADASRLDALPSSPQLKPHALRPLDILILGGTGFIGPYQVRAALRRGHRVTVFNRGQRDIDLPPEVVRLRGDRNIETLDLDALRGKTWDAAIDNSQIDPRWVAETTKLLKDAVGRYLYVSSTGVFAPYDAPFPVTEATPPRLTDNDLGETKTYGVIKALSEVENNKTFGDRAINVRPNFIVGPGDPTPRFLYWPARHAVGGEIMVPGRPDDHVQFADVRDLTAFMIHLVEQGASGTFNTAGEDDITMQRFQQGLALAVPSQHSLTWIADHEFLRSHRIGGMVPWIPPKRTAQGSAYGQTYINSDKAVSVGLRYRPMTETIRDTFAWWRSLAQEKRETYQFPMTPAREQILLSAWHEQGKALG